MKQIKHKHIINSFFIVCIFSTSLLFGQSNDNADSAHCNFVKIVIGNAIASNNRNLQREMLYDSTSELEAYKTRIKQDLEKELESLTPKDSPCYNEIRKTIEEYYGPTN